MFILVVDDEVEIRQPISTVLTDEGYKVDEAKMGIQRWLTSAPRRSCPA